MILTAYEPPISLAFKIRKECVCLTWGVMDQSDIQLVGQVKGLTVYLRTSYYEYFFIGTAVIQCVRE